MPLQIRRRWAFIRIIIFVVLLLTVLRSVDNFLKLHRSKQFSGLKFYSNVNFEPKPSSTDISRRHEAVHRSMTVTNLNKAGSAVNKHMKQDIFGNDLMNKTDGVRKDVCHSCFVHGFEYVIDSGSICNLYNASQTIDLLVVIATRHDNRQQRDAIRDTWLTPTKRNTANVRYAFLLGETRDLKQRQKILEESKKYRDIIKEDFADTYVNLTYKTVMGMKWATMKCSVAKYFMKTDDDVYVNLVNLLTLLQLRGNELLKSLAGKLNTHTSPIRNENSKYFASKESYPQAEYPDYCIGCGYITSLEVVRKIYEVSPNVPFFHIEDVYVGLCLQQLGYSTIDIPNYFAEFNRELDLCLLKGDNLFGAHGVPPQMMQTVWREECGGKIQLE